MYMYNPSSKGGRNSEKINLNFTYFYLQTFAIFRCYFKIALCKVPELLGAKLLGPYDRAASDLLPPFSALPYHLQFLATALQIFIIIHTIIMAIGNVSEQGQLI